LLLPETERLANRIVVLPSGTAIGEDEVSGICQVVRLATANGRALRESLHRPQGAARSLGAVEIK
jgi:hypothetical protein